MAVKTLIQTIEVGAGGSAIDFTSIPQIYDDLLVVLSTRMTSNAGIGYVTFRFNGDSTSNYEYIFMNGSGAGLFTNKTTSNTLFLTTSDGLMTAGVFGDAFVYLPRYNSGLRKSVIYADTSENNGTNSFLDFGGAVWNSTNAITSITFQDVFQSSTAAQYSTASLYGIKST